MFDDEPKKTVYTEIDREFKRMKPGTEFCRIELITKIKDFHPGSVRSGIDHFLLKKMSKGEVKRIDKGKYMKLWKSRKCIFP